MEKFREIESVAIALDSQDRAYVVVGCKDGTVWTQAPSDTDWVAEKSIPESKDRRTKPTRPSRP